ncbi:HDOD domain-containing protein [Pleionea litopenaei]|uniref:HDOD domain-containing protein n=1 Tax=Pleionea litopenaei TaxID=3070815 RepID=A0AA51X8P6_9GAMM|nr:HDOD domain-containing protein [Pleionea sp. HL-JVS1]WMS89201.1 HDOD domain-containing protein [Pleionea sp. HL-JVS1]
MAQALSYTAPQLIEKFCQFEIPILTPLEALQTCLANHDCAAADIARLTATDPIFCLYMQKLAGEIQAQRNGEVNGLEHALSMIGIEGIRAIAGQLKNFEKEHQPEMRQVLAESVLASHIAKHLAKMKTGYTKDIEAAALFARATEWLMYWMHPKRSWQLRRMFYRKPMSYEQASEVLFGFQFGELQKLVSESFFLPHLNQRLANFSLVPVSRELLQAVTLHRQNDLRLEECSRALRLHLGAPEMTPIIANRLAQIVCSPWLRNAWSRWKDIAAIHCHQKDSQVTQAVIQSCREVDTLHVQFPQFQLASALIDPPSPSPYAQYLSITTTATTNSPVAINANASKRDKQVNSNHLLEKKQREKTLAYTATQRTYLKGLYRKLMSGVDGISDAKSAITQFAETLIEHSPLERVVFIVINQAGTKAKSLLTKAKQTEHENLVISVDFAKNKVWQKFLAHQAFLQFDQMKHQAYWSQLPDSIQNEHITHFILNSLFYRNKVRALIYGDMPYSKAILPPEFIKDFKLLCTSLAERLRVG